MRALTDFEVSQLTLLKEQVSVMLANGCADSPELLDALTKITLKQDDALEVKARKPLTKNQLAVFEFIQTHCQQHHLPPTRAEIANQFGFRSANAAQEYIQVLAKKGYIEILPGASRGIRIL